ncbi:DUF5615 family PIN-like protein [bacterium]|nr:DUF5615 family PIN-like protein [bacterium]
MKFLLDQDVYEITYRFLKDSGHDVVKVSEIGFEQASDLEILKESKNQNRILITRDRDFGELVFLKHLETGVFYLRVNPLSINAVHEQLLLVLKKYSARELMNAFIVIEPGHYRLRKL